jgi:hypothetical protein
MWISWLMERRSLIWRVAFMILNASNCGERLKLGVKVRMKAKEGERDDE